MIYFQPFLVANLLRANKGEFVDIRWVQLWVRSYILFESTSNISFLMFWGSEKGKMQHPSLNCAFVLAGAICTLFQHFPCFECLACLPCLVTVATVAVLGRGLAKGQLTCSIMFVVSGTLHAGNTFW